MKRLTLLFPLFLMFTLCNKTDAMELEKPKAKIATVKLVSASDIIPPIAGNNEQLKSLIASYQHIEKNPLLVCCKVSATLTKTELHCMMDNMLKNNPELSQAVLQNPAFRDDFINEFMNKPMPFAIPAKYLANKKPNDVIAYAGNGNPNSAGMKLSENEGNKVTSSIIFSTTDKDPLFIEPPHSQYVVTNEFCKEANKVMNMFEASLREKEQNGDIQTMGDRDTNRQAMGDRYGITTGWNGGKPFMDTEKRAPSLRQG